MTQTEYKVVFTALGFLAVILRDTPNDRQADRAAAIADLIESCCIGAVRKRSNAKRGNRHDLCHGQDRATDPCRRSDHKDEDRTFAPAGRIAAAMIAIIAEKGGCLPQDLNERGFSPRDVALHWHLAQSLAAVELKLMRERPTKSKSIFGRK